MKSLRDHIVIKLVILGGAFAVLIFILLAGRLPASIETNPMKQVEEAWALARQSSSYSFSADVFQQTIPLPKATNIGRQSREEALYIEGRANIPEEKMELFIWSGSGSLQNEENALQIRMGEGQAQARQPGGEWEVLEDYTSLYAPEGDMLAYLAAARDVANQGSEVRNGVSFTRYTFSIDGQAFAIYLRNQMEQRMKASGQLTARMQIDLPHLYVNVEGDGELWVDKDGLPLRQIINLQFPETEDEQIVARIDSTFSGYGKIPEQASNSILWEKILSSNQLIEFGFIGITLGGLALMISFRQSRGVYIAIVVVFILSMVLSPVLESAQAGVLYERQSVQLQKQAESKQALKASENLTQALWTGITGNVSGLLNHTEIANTLLIDQEGYSSERLLEETTNDYDEDGLTDYQELKLGTSPDNYDTDNDLITDTLEVKGFFLGGKWWYTDPLSYDSNQDGLFDGDEWYTNQVDNQPGDTNEDGIPDLFDRDNDADGVPDDVDLSPYQPLYQKSIIFDAENPFKLKIENLPAEPTYVEFQVRPSNAERLWYAYNVLDWPEGDEQGQIKDSDGTTFSGANPAGNGDLKLQPMLEIRISGVDFNLPPTNTLETLYGVSTSWLDNLHTQKAAYVPVQLTNEGEGENRVAFYGKMLYEPGSTWNTQEVRLVWAVQALVDICEDYSDVEDHEDECIDWELNQSQIVQVYYDEWSLTGLRVVVNESSQMGVLWEDPEFDSDNDNDTPLFALSSALENGFYPGIVNDLEDRFGSASGGQSIEQTWGITPTLIAEETFDFEHPDEAAATMAMTNTFSILKAQFTPEISPGTSITPTLIFVSEDNFRAANLDDLNKANGLDESSTDTRLLTIDMNGFGSQATVSMRWQPFCYRGALARHGWEMCPIYEYMDELDRRLSGLFTDEVDLQKVWKKRTLLASYYLVQFKGSSTLVAVDQQAISLSGITDPDLDTRLTNQVTELLEGGLDLFSTRIFGRMGGEAVEDIKDVFKGYSSRRKTTAIVAETAAALIGACLFFTEEENHFIEGTASALEITAMVLDDLWEAISDLKALNLAKSLVAKSRLISSQAQADTMVKVTFKQLRNKSLGSPPSKIGLAIDLILIWGMFAYQMISGWNDMTNITFQLMLAGAVSATVISVFLFILAAIFVTGIGAVIVVVLVVLLAILELIAVILGDERWSPTAQVAEFLYSMSPIVDPGVTMTNTVFIPNGSFAPTINGSMRFATTLKLAATPTTDKNWKATLWPWLWWEDNLERTALIANIKNQSQDLTTTHGTMNDLWQSYGGLFGIGVDKLERSQPESQNLPLVTAGINESLPLYMNVAYDVPVASCWFALLWTVCTTDFVDDHFSQNFGQNMILDVFPATLDEFYRLNWDPLFTAQRDHDGDGLLAAFHGGPDPDDFKADGDDDGLSDHYELELRSAGERAAAPSLSSADTDSDGLGDSLEVHLGTLPNQRDSDGDGLNDGQEVFHQEGMNNWVGGWTYTISSTLSTLVTSNPLKADSDSDGLDDLTEQTLGENPNAWTASPVKLTAWIDPDDRIIAPGSSFVYTVTLTNQAAENPPLYFSGELQAAVPAVPGGETFTDTLTVVQGQAASLSHTIGVPDGIATPQGSLPVHLFNSLNGFLHDGDPNTYWTWITKTVDTTNLAGHWQGFPPYTRIAAQGADAPGAAEPYLIASIERSKGADKDAHVNLRQASDSLYDPQDALPLNSVYPRRFLGGYSPGVACNDGGECLVTWERSRYDPTITYQLRNLWAMTFFFFFDDMPLDPLCEFELHVGGVLKWYYQCFFISSTVWDFATAVGGDPNQLYSTSIVPYTKAGEEPAGITLLYKERDSGYCSHWFYNDDECMNFTIHWQESYFDPNHPLYADDVQWQAVYNGDDPLGAIDAKAKLFRPYEDGVYAALRGENGSLGPEIIISQTESTDYDQTTFDLHGPSSVASNGEDFLVAWVFNTAGGNRIYTRKISSTGTYSPNSVGFIQGNRDASNPQVAWVDAAERYIVAWNDSAQGVQALPLHESGALIGNTPYPTLLTGPLNQPQIDMAVNDGTGQVLLAYVEENTLKGAWLSIKSENQSDWVQEDGSSFVIAQLTPGDLGMKSPSVAYEPFSGGWMVSWLVQEENEQTVLRYAALDAAGNLLQDKIGTGPSASHPNLTGETSLDRANQQDLACSNHTTGSAHCAITGIQGSDLAPQQFLQPIVLDDKPPSLGEIQKSAATIVWVDAMGPSTTISLSNGSAYYFTGIKTIGGTATDPGEVSAGVDFVEVSTDGGMTWERAAGAESWAYNWTVPAEDGQVILQSRAVDKLGMQGETNEITVTLDRSGPVISLVTPANKALRAIWDEGAQLWRLPLSIQTSDAWSEIVTVEASVDPDESGWIAATLNNGVWEIEYPLESSDPTGIYTVRLRATDQVDNRTELVVPWKVKVDHTKPMITLDTGNAFAGAMPQSISSPMGDLFANPITQPFTMTGVISDTGEAASGLDLLQISLAPAGQDFETWIDIPLDNPASFVSTWSYRLPEPLEGLYQVSLRGQDQAGNLGYADSLNGMLIEIDTRPPAASCSLTQTGDGSASQTDLAGWGTDFNLVRDGFSFACPSDRIQPGYYADAWYREVYSDTTRLYRLDSTCTLNGHIASQTLAANDRYGRSTAVECSIQVDPPGDLPLTAILSPTDGQVITDTAKTVDLVVGAYAVNGLNALEVKVNDEVLHTNTWTCPPGADPTPDASLPILWNLSGFADGNYQLTAQATDCQGAAQASPASVTLTVDTQVPVLTLEPTRLSLQQLLSSGRVVLGGAASDNTGLAVVQVSFNGGAIWQEASFEAGAWRYTWFLGDIETRPDGVAYPVMVRAVDRAGHMTLLEQTVIVDVDPPEPVGISLYYDSGDGPVALDEQATIAFSNPDLILEWTPSSDGGGPLTYLADWSTSPEPDPGSLTAYTDIHTHTETWDGAPAALYAHLIVKDASGNSISQTRGPFYVDSPRTPDYISDLGYHGWINEGCNLIGANGEAARYADSAVALDDTQKLYATWDAQNLRLAWTGANWESDGDLFIYLDATSGGSGTAFDPYGSGPVISLPSGMDADYLVWVEDGETAGWFAWDGSQWSPNSSLGSDRYRFEYGDLSITDLLLPLNWFGAPESLSLFALASEEDALRIWAAVPDKNPLNSQQAVDLVAHPYLDRPFALTQAYLWDNLGDGVCSNNELPAGSDLHFNLTASPAGVSAGYLEDDLAGLLVPDQPLDADRDGTPDLSLPLDTISGLVGLGETVLYTLVYTNTGSAAAEDVQVFLNAYGLSGLPLDLTLGDIGPGSSGSVSMPANVMPGVQTVELDVQIEDARHGTFEWLWVQHTVDNQPPQDVSIDLPETYLRPGANLISGHASDPSGITSIELDIQGVVSACAGPGPGGSLWSCSWNAPVSGEIITGRVRAIDRFGNTSEWTLDHAWTLDSNPPSIALSTATQDALADGLLTGNELIVSGTITDDHQPNRVEVCAWDDEDPLGECVFAQAVPGDTPGTADWSVAAPVRWNTDNMLSHLTFRGFDEAGNAPLQPITWFGNADVIGPEISLTLKVDKVAQGSPRKVLSGFVTDGSGVDSLILHLADPDGNVVVQVITPTITTGAWEYTGFFDQLGSYWPSLEAQDVVGNSSQLTLSSIEVLDQGMTSDLAVELAAIPVTAISGQPLTYTVSVMNAGPGVALNTMLTFNLPAAVSLIDAGGCMVSGDSLGCLLGDLHPEQATTRTVEVFVPLNVTQTLAAEAQVSSDKTDPDSSNNHKVLYTAVVQPITGLTAASSSPTALGASTTLTATVSSGQPVFYHWDFGDGETGDGPEVSHAYVLDPDFTGPYPLVGVYTATVTASNDYNQMVASTRVEILNLAPELITDGLDQITYEDERTWTGYIYFTELNSPDSHTATIDWGDGETSLPDDMVDYAYGGKLIGSHIYADPGAYTVTVTVLDSYGGTGTGTFTITVLNGFLRLCAYAGGQDPGVYLYPDARLECAWNAPDQLIRVTASGVGSRGNIQIEDGVVISGSLRSQGQTLIPGEDVRLVGGLAERDFDVLTIGNIDSQGNVDLGIRGDVAGDVASRADVYLRAHSLVGGDVYANGKVMVAGSATISGTIMEDANLPPISSLTPITMTLVAGVKDITVDQRATLSLDPGDYGNLLVKKGGILELRYGWYKFESITVGQDATIKIDLTRGALLVDVVKTLVMGEGTQMKITSSSGEADKILFRVGGNTVYLMKNGEYLGTYMAFGGQVRLGLNAILTGALYGKAVHVMDRARITGLPARNLFAITMVNPDLPLGCADRVTCSWVFMPHVTR